MKIRLLLMISFIAVLFQSDIQAQEYSHQSQQMGRFRNTPGGTPDSLPIITRVFALTYYPAEEMLNILASIRPQDTQITTDRISNQLIASGPSRELDRVEALITELDIPNKSTLQSRPIMCRVYMLELPPRDKGLKSFTLKISASDDYLETSALERIDNNQLKIISIESPATEPYCIIKGFASSCAAIGQFLPNREIMDLHFEERKSFIPDSQLAPLSESLQNHINRFLGEKAEIAGYWFGNLSVPGSTQAPIGPWRLEFDMGNLGTDGFVDLDLGVNEVREGYNWSIMHNSMRTRIGYPVIIGYTRDKDGAPTTGALVVISEPMPEL